MSILRGTFPKRVGSSDDGGDVRKDENSGAGRPEFSPEESVTSALARLRKFHKRDEAPSVAPTDAAPPESQLQQASEPTPEEAPAVSLWDVDDPLAADDDEPPVTGSGGASMWDVDPLDAGVEDAPPVPVESVTEAEAAPAPVETAPVAPAAPARRTGRVRTRLLGFEHSNGSIEDIGTTHAAEEKKVEGVRFPVGWLVIVAGPGRGTAIPLQTGVSQIGRDDDQAVALDFGDMAISRQGHAILAYDDETRAFYLGHGGKQNIVRLNSRPVLGTEEVKHGDLVRIGETTLKLATLCGQSFSWSEEPKAPVRPAE